MRLTRRSLLALTGAAVATPAFAAAPRSLTAAPASYRLAPEGYAAADLWLYDGTSPGPEIRVAQGARVERRLDNHLPEGSAVHWHGIRIDNAMDGVPGLTQGMVPPGGSFDYGFVVPDAGTFWYHAHNHSQEQVARGLYGPLIVEETVAPDVDRDVSLVIDDWRLSADGGLAGGFGALHDNAHGGRLGNFVTVNGAETGRIEARRGERLRVRLTNAANARIFRIGWQGLSAHLMALDGMPLETPVPAGEVTLAPGQRADIFADVLPGADAPVLFMVEQGEAYVLADIVAGAGGGTTRGAPGPLPPNPIGVPGSGARTMTLLLEGGAMGGMAGARLDGRDMDASALAAEGMVWAMNGQAGMGAAPLLSGDRGETWRIRIENATAWPHGMHMHGHHFREIAADGSPGPWRDTTLVAPREVREIVMLADNPGKWLLHCHMLGHQASGMKTWFEVRD